MAVPGIKFDDGTGGFASNCFPVRTLISQNEEATSGAWLIAQRAEERRRFKALICSKPRTYAQIRNERKKAERNNTTIVPPHEGIKDEEDEDKILDGFFLMKHCCVDDPSDLCSINISGQSLCDVKGEDLQLFDNVAYVNASENLLSLESLKNFPILRELELSLNGMRGVKLQQTDFLNLETLDLSYNNLSAEDLLSLGLLQNIKILHLTGNGLYTLPEGLARPHLDEQAFERVPRFKSLEVLMLDDNKLSDPIIFAAIAGLRRLKHLDLSKNQIKSIPQLLLIEGKHVAQDADKRNKHGRRSRPSSRQSQRSARSTPIEKPNLGETNMENPSLEKPDSIPLNNAPSGHTEENVPLGGVESTGQVESSTSLGITGTKPSQVQSSGDVQQSDSNELSAMPSMGDLGTLSDLHLEELNLDAMTENIMASMPPSKSNTRVEEENTFERSNDSDMPLPPPFPELRHLNLSHNLIAEEEGLLAVAAWPMLSELLIHDNPLTTHNSGNPPLLQRFLCDRLGITVHRKCPDDPHKPHIEVPTKPDRKVVTRILPVPRCNVEELLALEAPKTMSIQATPETSARGTPTSKGVNTPKGTPTPKGATTPKGTPTPKSTTPATPHTLDNTKVLPPIPSTPTPDSPEQEDAAAFFMTQVDEAGNEKAASSAREASETSPFPSYQSQSSDHSKSHSKVPSLSKYKGYEALLDMDSPETDTMPTPKDLPSNIRALQYALAHPLVFRENPTDLQIPQPPCRPLVKAKYAPSSKPRKTKAEQMTDALTHLKARSTVVEVELKTVLDNKKRQKSEFKDADQLLAKVQHRYNAVRASSMKEARDLHKGKDALKDTIKDVRKQLNQIAKTSA